MNTSELIYDWNKNHPPGLKPPGPVLLNDESLRDGLQSPSVRDPSIAEKIEILHLMEALGIDSLDLGLPGAGPRAVEHVTALAREIVAHKMKIRANCAARTHENDIRPIAEIVQKTGLPHRGGDLHRIQPHSPFHRRLERRFSFAHHREGREVCGFARPRRDVRDRRHDPLRSRDGEAALFDGDQLRRAGHCDLRHRRSRHSHGRAGAGAICDGGSGETFGRKDSRGLARAQRPRPGDCQFHGGGDRGRELRARCAIGLGERVGNTQIDQMLVNLKLMGIAPWDEQDLTKLKHYCQAVRGPRACRFRRTIRWWATMRFAPLRACTRRRSSRRITRMTSYWPTRCIRECLRMCFGLEQIIDIGPMSGKSNVLFWLERRGIPASDEPG
jgi:2-isopropylmalate synthase